VLELDFRALDEHAELSGCELVSHDGLVLVTGPAQAGRACSFPGRTRSGARGAVERTGVSAPS
jgi:hypothetical protein